MMAAYDLSEFRNEWLKELQQNEEQKPSTSGENATECALKFGLHAKQSTDSKGHLSTQDGEEDFHDSERSSQNNSSVYADSVYQEQSIVGNQNDLSATYYPFRILTTLLNSACTEGPKRTNKCKTKSVDNSHGKDRTVTPKRTYFSATDEFRNESDIRPITKKVKLELEFKVEEAKNDASSQQTERKDYLDLFIEDLNEINEIPFFDVSLPREVAIKIFWYLDVVDLCRCAQVSRSWRSLAEDELLWCRICHRLGFEKDTLTVEHSNWKNRVCQYSVIKRTLELNWKGRTGRLHNLHHAKGGVLCAAHSFHSTVVAGYSNCQIKLWDVMSGETCVFQPSSTALLIDEEEEEGTIKNEVLHVATCDKITAASYNHGFVDVWSNEEGTEPVYTFTCEGRGSFKKPTSLHLWENQHLAHLAVSSGHTVQVHTVRNCQGRVKDTAVFESVVKQTAWIQPDDQASHSMVTPTLAVATNSTVHVLALHDREANNSYDLVELHNIVDAPVTCIDTRLEPSQVAVGFTLSTGPAQYFRVDIYDIVTKKMMTTLTGHTSWVLCINMADSPQHQLVTGSQDRKVRVYDTRVAQSAMMTLIGHSAPITTLQMDEQKVVSGDEGGFIRVWDRRMASKLWEMNNRHPVRYCHFEERELVIGHVPYVKQHYSLYDMDTGLHQRHRGSLHVYDFLADQTRQGVPEICLSSFDEPQGYNYNIALAVPYDQV